MENAGYTTLTRQSGLLREMQSVANNLANMSTSGYRREGLIFAEYVQRVEGENESLSMATANVRNTSFLQGTLTKTGGTFDFGIEGPGFFLLETPAGERLTRAGSFTPGPEGELVSPDGYRLLDAGGAPVFVPPDATDISLAADGTLSANGIPLAQIGLFQPVNPSQLRREDGVRFVADAGVEPVERIAILQGFVENANVDPVLEVTRMIEVQRAYELGQGFLDQENERVRNVLRTLGS